MVIHNNNWNTIFLAGDHEFESYKPEQLYPIPLQDQLQEMVGGYKEQKDMITGYGYCENEYNKFKDMPCTGYWDMFTSMEQLWLAFVMKERHNKIWDGDKWIKEVT